MEVLSQKGSYACVSLHSTTPIHHRQLNFVPCLRSPSSTASTSRALPSIDLHRYAGFSGPMHGSTAPRHNRGRSSLICSAGEHLTITRTLTA